MRYFHKRNDAWIPGPVFDVAAGRVSETVVLTKSGFLFGAVGLPC